MKMVSIHGTKRIRYGVGPFYGMGIIVATVIGIVLSVTEVYSIVRSPCYSGIMLMCTGMLFMANGRCLERQ